MTALFSAHFDPILKGKKCRGVRFRSFCAWAPLPASHSSQDPTQLLEAGVVTGESASTDNLLTDFQVLTDKVKQSRF